MDITCAKCGEPWDSYCQRDGTFTPEEWRKFARGEGCPSCGYGSRCPSCSGSGLASYDGYQSGRCCSNGTARAWKPERSGYGYTAGVWHVGYSPRIVVVPSPRILRADGGHQTADGWVYEAVIACPTCDGKGAHLDPCPSCDGTGKLTHTSEERGILATMAAVSHLDASDEEPVGILMDRGIW